ncbi:hypothetical protein R3P38DRAFT_3469246 [Favolaschia claudopus]|uniref:SMP-30/Gluconolactonase/LRE-like region domain-containing protein n=1 Tax=Favolaschia claudopus TaxID=2862362 RepID=A0AAW0CNA0_9AGAR
MFPLSSLVLLLTAASVTIATNLPTRLIYESPTGLFLEGIAVRPSGQLLLTSVVSPTLYTLDPTSPNPTLDEVYTFPNATSLNGIVEYAPDTFALVVSSLSTTEVATPLDSVVIYSISFPSTSSNQPIITPAARIPCSTMTNGISTHPGDPSLILAADSHLGVAWEVNMLTGAVRIALHDAALEPGLTAPWPGLGINGLRAHTSASNLFLYFTNSASGTFARVLLAARAPVEILGTQPKVDGVFGVYDDFVFDEEGRAWVTLSSGAVQMFSPSVGNQNEWVQETVAGDPKGGGMLDGATACAFGRDTKTLYVTTSKGRVVVIDTAAGISKINDSNQNVEGTSAKPSRDEF